MISKWLVFLIIVTFSALTTMYVIGSCTGDVIDIIVESVGGKIK